MSTHQKGLTAALKHINSAPDINVKIMKKLMIVNGEKVSTAAKNVVNVDFGTLKGSINSQFKETSNQLVVTIGANTDYALAVHENPNLKGYKYLENPFLRVFSKIDSEYKKAIK